MAAKSNSNILDEEGFWRETLKKNWCSEWSILLIYFFYWNPNIKLIADILHEVQIAASNGPYW